MKKRPEQILLPYLKPDPKQIGVLRIDFNGLCAALYGYMHRSFSVVEFEAKLNEGIKKEFHKQPMNMETLVKICNFIDKLSWELTKKRASVTNGALTPEMRQEFRQLHKDRYNDILAKAKHRNPTEYERLKAKFSGRPDAFR